MSDDESKKQPIIVVKKKGGHGGHHGGAWKVAYADFVTAMMAFFLVMWLVNQSVVVREAVAGYFQDPAGFMEKLKKGGSQVMEGGKSNIKIFKFDKESLREKMTQQQEMLSDAGEHVKQTLQAMPEIGEMQDFIEIEVTPEGLMIQLIDASKVDDSAIFFDAGSAKLKPLASLILAAIAAELGQLPSHIIIEGHTDATPYHGKRDYTNWELSADRANSARRLMEKSGIRDSQIVSVRGYAANKPKDPEKPDDPQNRRVTIIVLNEEYEKYLRDISTNET